MNKELQEIKDSQKNTKNMSNYLKNVYNINANKNLPVLCQSFIPKY